MAKYRAVVALTEYYEVYVDAEDEEEAEGIAQETFMVEGALFNTLISEITVEEEE